MRRYFFLYNPYSVKTETLKGGNKDTKTTWKRNCEVRDEYIKKFGRTGKKGFDTISRDPNSKFYGYRDIEIPKMYAYAWEHFIAIWQQCETDVMGNRIFTYRTILEYELCMRVNLPIRIKRLIFKIKMWALDEIGKMKEEE